MEPMVKEIGKWKEQLGIVGETVWIHCNAHIKPALQTSLSKVLLELEGFIGKKYWEYYFKLRLIKSCVVCTQESRTLDRNIALAPCYKLHPL